MQRRTISSFWSSGLGWYYDVIKRRRVLVVLSCQTSRVVVTVSEYRCVMFAAIEMFNLRQILVY